MRGVARIVRDVGLTVIEGACTCGIGPRVSIPRVSVAGLM